MTDEAIRESLQKELNLTKNQIYVIDHLNFINAKRRFIGALRWSQCNEDMLRYLEKQVNEINIKNKWIKDIPSKLWNGKLIGPNSKYMQYLS